MQPKKHSMRIWCSSHPVFCVVFLLFVLLGLSMGMYYLYLTLNYDMFEYDDKVSREMNCKLTGGNWIEAGSEEACSSLDFEQCMKPYSNPHCMLWSEPVPNTAMARFVCKPLATCKCPQDPNGTYSYLGCK